jgi:hypothetical protein
MTVDLFNSLITSLSNSLSFKDVLWVQLFLSSSFSSGSNWVMSPALSLKSIKLQSFCVFSVVDVVESIPDDELKIPKI